MSVVNSSVEDAAAAINPNQWIQYPAGKGFGQTTIGKNLKAATDEIMNEDGSLKEPYDTLVTALKVVRAARLLLTTARSQSALYAVLLEQAIQTVENLVIDTFNGLDVYSFLMYPSPLKVNPSLYEKLKLSEEIAALQRADMPPPQVEGRFQGIHTSEGFVKRFGVEIGPGPGTTSVMEPFTWPQALNQLRASLNDPTDPDRPLFSEGSNMFGVVVALGVNVPNPNLIRFMQKWRDLKGGVQEAWNNDVGLSSIGEKLAAFATYESEETRDEFNARFRADSAYQGVPPNWSRMSNLFPYMREGVQYLISVIRNYALAGKFTKAMSEVQEVADEWVDVLLDALDLVQTILEIALEVLQALHALQHVNLYLLVLDPEKPPDEGLYQGMNRFMQRIEQAGPGPTDNTIIADCIVLRDPVGSTYDTLRKKWRTLTEFAGWGEIADAYESMRDEAGNLLAPGDRG